MDLSREFHALTELEGLDAVTETLGFKPNVNYWFEQHDNEKLALHFLVFRKYLVLEGAEGLHGVLLGDDERVIFRSKTDGNLIVRGSNYEKTPQIAHESRNSFDAGRLVWLLRGVELELMRPSHEGRLYELKGSLHKAPLPDEKEPFGKEPFGGDQEFGLNDIYFKTDDLLQFLKKKESEIWLPFRSKPSHPGPESSDDDSAFQIDVPALSGTEAFKSQPEAVQQLALNIMKELETNKNKLSDFTLSDLRGNNDFLKKAGLTVEYFFKLYGEGEIKKGTFDNRWGKACQSIRKADEELKKQAAMNNTLASLVR